MSDYPFNVEKQRERIDKHKDDRLANPYKAYTLEHHQTSSSCIEYWIEQIGDAEMYEQRWCELQEEGGAEPTTEKTCKRCNGQGEEFSQGCQSRYTTCPHCNGTGAGECQISCVLCSDTNEEGR